MKRLAICLAVLAFTCVTQAGAAIILQDLTNSSAQIDAREPFGQTFTAEDANIESIAFYFHDANVSFPNGSTTMKLFAGVDPTGSGTVLHAESQVLTPGAFGFVDFDFSSVLLTPGAEYTALVERPNARWAILRNVHTSNPPDYAGGDMIESGLVVTAADLRFRVTPLVPEPTSLSLMIWSLLGLTLGARWWRRRKQAA